MIAPCPARLCFGVMQGDAIKFSTGEKIGQDSDLALRTGVVCPARSEPPCCKLPITRTP